MPKMKNERFFGLRVGDAEMQAIAFLARKLERRRGDAVRFVIRQAAQNLQAQNDAEHNALKAGVDNALTR